MNRQIKFRGLSLDREGWLYGDLAHRTYPNEDGTEEVWTYINSMDRNEVVRRRKNKIFNTAVDPSTVGQFTGLLDRNGKEIYKGDIVKFHFMTFDACSSKLFPTEKFLGEITTNKYNQWCILSDGLEIHIENAIKYGEVIGNIHEQSKS